MAYYDFLYSNRIKLYFLKIIGVLYGQYVCIDNMLNKIKSNRTDIQSMGNNTRFTFKAPILCFSIHRQCFLTKEWSIFFSACNVNLFIIITMIRKKGYRFENGNKISISFIRRRFCLLSNPKFWPNWDNSWLVLHLPLSLIIPKK